MADFWQQVGEGLAQDFSDLPNAAEAVRITFRLLVAAALGGLLGWERQATGKAAGLRTHMLVSLGAALFVLVPERAGMRLEDISRIFQGITSGIGFLGAGAILKLSQRGRIKGLTTAAGIWLTAAVGMAAGMGKVASALIGAVLALLILAGLRRVEDWIVVRRKAPQPGPKPAPAADRAKPG